MRKRSPMVALDEQGLRHWLSGYYSRWGEGGYAGSLKSEGSAVLAEASTEREKGTVFKVHRGARQELDLEMD